MKNYYLLCIVSLLTLTYWQCNPKCESISGLKISSKDNPAGYEILIEANPSNVLQNRVVRFGNVEVMESDKRFVEGVGLIVKVPKDVSGKTELRIEDPDCEDFVALDFTVNSKDYYLKNPNYVFPLIPEIIIPTVPATFPSSIDKAWLNPLNTDYCLWLTVEKDTIRENGNIMKIISRNTLDEKNSFEQCTKCREADPAKVCGSIDATPLFKQNRIYGVYDSVRKYLHFWVDRSKNNPTLTQPEEFEGQLIDIKNTNYNKATFPHPCLGNLPLVEARHMLLVTSKKTGRQTLAFQLKL